VVQEIIDALTYIARVRGVKFDYVIECVKEALIKGAQRKFGKGTEVEVEFDPRANKLLIYLVKLVVDQVSDPQLEISLEEAKKIKPDVVRNEKIRIPIPIKALGRSAIDTIKQTLTQRVREAERDRIYEEYKNRVGEVVKGVIKGIDRNEIIVDLGPTEAVIPSYGQIRTDSYRLNEPIRAVILAVERAFYGPKVILSRSDPKFLERLLFAEVPELKEGVVEIIKVVRAPGRKAKVAVSSSNPRIDPVGTCVGYGGSRIKAVVKELGGERIDVIEYSKDPCAYIARALAPAKVTKVYTKDGEDTYYAVVPDDDYGKAIGKNRRNLQLAQELTGFTIEVVKQSEYELAQEEERLSQVKIDDLTSLSAEIREKLKSKGYENAFAVLSASKEELMSLLEVGEEELNHILEVISGGEEEKAAEEAEKESS